MKRICLGLHVHAEPERLRATLASVRENTSREVALLLLPDGADEPTRRVFERLTDVPQLATAEPRGVAACFNRLILAAEAEVYVLLESGSLVTRGWLDYLLAALNADPRHGLAGPSTNLIWNEQCAFPRARGEAPALARTAEEAARRFGYTWRALEPLHSLADFCYVVRREVVEAIGAADEGYGLGPCWEMDYNIRAARAGWRGVWARGAYVYRAPFTVRRQMEERRRFEASKRRYQDKFCALRLLKQRAGYEAHCRGEACEHFAPRALIQIQMQLPGAPSTPPAAVSFPIPTIRPRPAALEVQTSAPNLPLVSCIMPTRNRRAFVPRAIEYFLRQDYPHTELIILDDGSDPVSDLVPDHNRIRYLRLHERLTVGAKRNRACEAARGEIIAHWDDDDWHAARRLTYQVEALQREKAAVVGLNHLLFYDEVNNRAWRYVYPAPQRFWLAGSSLCYPRSFWVTHRFADVNVGEDARFVWSDPSAKMVALPDHTFHVGFMHADNISPKQTGGAYWHTLDVSEIKSVMGADFHQRTGTTTGTLPLISCIMPTHNRRAFIPLALQHFLSQDYPNKELLVVDDGSDPISDLVSNLPSVRYLRLESRLSIGAKRNLACRHARGELIAQWDDDDWYASNRLRYQAEPILRNQADITGLENTYLLELAAGQFWTLDQHLHQRMFLGNVHGGTLVFRKRLMDEGLRYPEVNLAEDAGLLKQALQRGQRLARLPNPGMFVYMRHDHNVWRFKTGQFLNPAGWQKIEPPSTFTADMLRVYQAAMTLPIPDHQ